MSRPLKVFGWQGWRTECPAAANGSHATREIVAATSKADAARKAGALSRSGRPAPQSLFNFGETGNPAEIAQAMSAPGTVFWCPFDHRRREEWRKA